ncbi:O-antigen ligase family protein [Candidatus Uhrbacteria bacterium]|nr:O-antigen ligase family protein [Candidatus Uhrbacteria bacterium]
MFQTRAAWEQVFFISTLVALVVTVAHFLSLFGIEFLYDASFGATFGNSTFFGTYLLFPIFFCVYLFTQARKPFLRWYAAVAFLIFVSVLFSIDANAAQMSFLGGLVLLASLLLISLGASHRQRTTGYAMLGSLLIAFLFVGFSLFQPQSAIRQYFIEQTSNARFAVWDMAWQGIKERPWLGWGPDNFGFVEQDYYHPCLGSPACGGEIWFDSAHNALLDVAVDSGVIGLLVYLALFITAIVQVWRPIVARKQRGAIPAILTTMLVVYFVQNLTSVDGVTSLLFFVLVLAAMSSSDSLFPHEKDFPVRTTRTPGIVPALATVLFPFAFLFFVIQPVKANRLTTEAIAPQVVDDHLRAYERALNGSAMGIDRRRYFLASGTADILWVSPRESVMGVASYARREIQLAENALLDTINRPHRDLRSYLGLGKLYQLEARLFDASLFQKAEGILKEAVELNASNPLPIWALASVYLEQGRVEEAAGLTEAALALNPDVTKSHLLNLVILRYLGDVQRLEQAVERAKEAQPAFVTKIDEVVSMKDLEAVKVDWLQQFYP